jgi:hypothetical protein
MRDASDPPIYDELFRVLEFLHPSLFRIVYGCVHSGKFWEITREDGLGDKNTNLQLCTHKRLTNRMLIKAVVEQDPFFNKKNNWVVNLFEKDATAPFDVHLWFDVPISLQCNCDGEEDLRAALLPKQKGRLRDDLMSKRAHEDLTRRVVLPPDHPLD